MDRQLKERLIGAIVVVALGVLIIPEFLSGPDETTTVSVDIDLPAAARPETRTYSFRLDEPAATPSAPVPAPASSAQVVEEPVEALVGTPEPESEPLSKPAQQLALPEPPAVETNTTASAAAAAPAPSGKTETPAQADGSNWVVQLGSFSSEDNAKRLAAQLKAKGYQSFVTRYAGPDQVLHRVRVGPAGTREQADALAQRLAGQGQVTKVVPQL